MHASLPCTRWDQKTRKPYHERTWSTVTDILSTRAADSRRTITARPGFDEFRFSSPTNTLGTIACTTMSAAKRWSKPRRTSVGQLWAERWTAASNWLHDHLPPTNRTVMRDTAAASCTAWNTRRIAYARLGCCWCDRQEGLAVARIARYVVVEMTPPRLHVVTTMRCKFGSEFET